MFRTIFVVGVSSLCLLGLGLHELDETELVVNQFADAMFHQVLLVLSVFFGFALITVNLILNRCVVMIDDFLSVVALHFRHVRLDFCVASLVKWIDLVERSRHPLLASHFVFRIDLSLVEVLHDVGHLLNHCCVCSFKPSLNF